MSVIQTSFSALLYMNFRVNNALNFIRNVSDSNLYLGIGKTSPWSLNENDPDFVPPPPQDILDYKNRVWNDLIGITKVQELDVRAVVPRIDWGDPDRNTLAYVFNIGDIVVVNSIQGVNNHPQHGTGLIVYKCVDTPDTGTCSIDGPDNQLDCESLDGTWTPTASPGGVDNIPRGSGSGIDTGDGYKWDFLYRIPASDQANYVSDGWIVVPTPDDLIGNFNDWGLENELASGREFRIMEQAESRWVSAFVYVNSADFSSLIEQGLAYRQLSLIANPLRLVQNSQPLQATEDIYLKDELVEDGGSILFVENRPPIVKTAQQTEEVQLIFEF